MSQEAKKWHKRRHGKKAFETNHRQKHKKQVASKRNRSQMVTNECGSDRRPTQEVRRACLSCHRGHAAHRYAQWRGLKDPSPLRLPCTGLHTSSQVGTGFHRYRLHRSSQFFTDRHRCSQIFTDCSAKTCFFPTFGAGLLDFKLNSSPRPVYSYRFPGVPNPRPQILPRVPSPEMPNPPTDSLECPTPQTP